MKKPLNLQPSSSSIATSWKDYNIDWNSHNGDISLKKFSSNSINFHRFKSKPSDFHFNPLISSATFLYPLKTSEKRMLSDVCRGYKYVAPDIKGSRRPWSKEKKLLIYKSSSKNSTQYTRGISNYIYLLEPSVISFHSCLWYQLIGPKRNPWVTVNLQSSFIYSSNMSTF